MSGSRARILLVDDFAPWRQYVRTLLEEARPDLSIESEASDGIEAVKKATEIQPDLILLDIGLPKLNGIGVLRRILTISPASKIILLTQENPVDFMAEAISLGAMGYVSKASAGSDLVRAIDAVLQGQRFLMQVPNE